MTINDPEAFAARVSANLGRLLHEATDPFYSAKQPIEFILESDARISYPGRYIRTVGAPGQALVAVTPAVRAEIVAAITAGQPDAESRRRAGARVNSLPIRADGLIALTHLATRIIADPTNASMTQDALRKRHFARQEESRKAAQRQRRAAIEDLAPTAEVDAWIIAHMGYTAETLAALGKATRRDRRREARRQMMI